MKKNIHNFVAFAKRKTQNPTHLNLINIFETHITHTTIFHCRYRNHEGKINTETKL